MPLCNTLTSVNNKIFLKKTIPKHVAQNFDNVRFYIGSRTDRLKQQINATTYIYL